MTIYICMDEDNGAAIGNSLTDSWKKYEDVLGGYGPNTLRFYKAEQVEIDIIEKPVVVRVPTAKKPTNKK